MRITLSPVRSRWRGQVWHLRQPARLGGRDAAAERRNPVVAATLVVHFRRRTGADLDDEPLLQHPLDRRYNVPALSFKLPPVRAVTSCMIA